MFLHNRCKCSVEAEVGVDDPHVGGGGLGDDGGDAPGVRVEGGAHGVKIVIREHECLRGRCRRHTG